MRLWWLTRSRDSFAHFWLLKEVLDLSLVSVELQAPALFPRSVAAAACADMSTYATLVHASVVLELVTNFLSFTLE